MESIPQQTKPNKQKNSARWFKHDSGAHNDPKIYKLICEIGYQGYGIFWLTIELLRDAPGGRLSEEALKILYRKESVSDAAAQKFLDTALTLELLFLQDGFVFSERLTSDMEAMSAAGKKAGLASAQNKKLEGELNARQRASTVVDGVQRRPTDNLVLSPLVSSDLISSGKEGAGGKPIEARTAQPLPVPQTELERMAEDLLEPPESQAVKTSSVFISCGRRPLKKYPLIWMTRSELVQTIELFDKSSIPRAESKYVLQNIQAKLTDLVAKGGDPSKKSGYSWVTGFGLTDYLDQRKKKLDLARSETYLANAKEAARV